MTVGELIKELLEFNLDLIVVYNTQEDTYSPSPSLQIHDFDSNYWDSGNQYIKLPKNTEFVRL